MAKISFHQFGMDFLSLVFTKERLKKELDKGFVRQVPIETKEAHGTATIMPCTVIPLPREGRPGFERVYDVYIPFSMYLRIDLPLGQEKYKVNGQVQMRLWLEAYPGLVLYLNGYKVPKAAVQLTATGDGNWLNADIAKKFGLEDKLKENMAIQFTDEFAKSQASRIIKILDQVNGEGGAESISKQTPKISDYIKKYPSTTAITKKSMKKVSPKSNKKSVRKPVSKTAVKKAAKK